MRILIVVVAILSLAIGFFAGKFTSTPQVQSSATISSAVTELNRETPKLTENKPITTIATSSSIISNAKSAYEIKDCAPNVATNAKENIPSIATSNKTANPSAAIDTPNKSKLKFTTVTELSNESVDELVPKPFNNAIKNMHGQFKEKYADFLASDEKNEWAENAENYLNDALNNGMLGNSMEINSIKCKASLCEVRVYEREANTAIPNIIKQLNNFTNYFQQSQMNTSTDANKRTYITYLMLAK